MDDPILHFYSEEQADQPNLLYHTLRIDPTATADQVRKSYRRLALLHHPDKQSTKSDAAKQDAASEFHRIGYAYAVLSDEKRRKMYDSTGKTADNAFADAEEMGWDAYFETLFTRIDRAVLDEDRDRYQGSSDEKEDLKRAYVASNGSLPAILERIPHATHEDEDRLVCAVNALISHGVLIGSTIWDTTSKDKTARNKRGKSAAKQAKEAEAAARQLGVWDEFYGSGKKGNRKGSDGKSTGSGESSLQALILKRQQDRAGALDAMEEKYARMEAADKAKRQAKGKKRKSDVEPPQISDAEFEALQARMFDKGPGSKKAKK